MNERIDDVMWWWQQAFLFIEIKLILEIELLWCNFNLKIRVNLIISQLASCMESCICPQNKPRV